jgi:cell division protein FtsQ
MDTKKTIQEILFAGLWLSMAAGLLVLLVAAIGKKNREHCKDYVITIKGVQNNFFIDRDDVMHILCEATKGKIKGEKIASFNLRRLEQLLKNNVWAEEAELYFDNQDVLHISILEREPIARIFTISGNSFYIDNTARQIPLSDKMSARVPVFTNFPDQKVLNEKDSLILNDVKKIAQFIMKDEFWMAQVEQIDISQCGFKCWQFEMIPTIGNHIVKLGNGEDIEKKFHRLLLFYREVISKTGFDKYNVINVQYAGQVIGSKKQTTKIDSIQLRLNIEKLLQQARESEKDTVTAMIVPPSEKQIVPAEQKRFQQKKLTDNRIKSKKENKSFEKPKNIEQQSGDQQPKAVMSPKIKNE